MLFSFLMWHQNYLLDFIISGNRFFSQDKLDYVRTLKFSDQKQFSNGGKILLELTVQYKVQMKLELFFKDVIDR